MDAADIASDLQELSVNARLSQIARTQLTQGQPDCEECGTAIPRLRRKAAPWARHCLPCQEIIEQQGRHVMRLY